MATVTTFNISAIPTLLEHLPLTRPPDTQDGVIRLGSNLGPARQGIRLSKNIATTPARTVQRNSWAGGSDAFKALTAPELATWNAQAALEQMPTRKMFMREWRIRHYHAYTWPFDFFPFWCGYCAHVKIWNANATYGDTYSFTPINPNPLGDPYASTYFAGTGNFKGTVNLTCNWTAKKAGAWFGLTLGYMLNGGPNTVVTHYLPEGFSAWQNLNIEVTSNPTSWIATAIISGDNIEGEFWLDEFGIKNSTNAWVTPNPHFNEKKCRKLQNGWLALIGYDVYFESCSRGLEISYPPAEWQ